MKKVYAVISVLLTVCMLISVASVVSFADDTYADAYFIELSSVENSDGSFTHTAQIDGKSASEYDYVWHADPSEVHSDVKNSPAEYFTGTAPSGDEAVYVAHDIYYYPELPTSGFKRQNYDGEQEWCYYYTAEGYTSYIFSTLPGSSTLPTDMMHSEEEAYNNAVLHITQPGTYVLSGEWNGQVWVDLGDSDTTFTDETAKVNLVLNGVDINCTVAPAIVYNSVYECDNTWEDQSSWSYNVDTTDAGAILTVADDTVNNLNGTNIFRILKTQYKSGSTSVQKKRLKQDGALYSYQSLNIEGGEKDTGILNLTAGYEGLGSELHLTINGGNININSQDDGINVNEDSVSVVTINGGVLHILAGLGSEGDGIDSNGYLVVNGGTVITMANPGADSGMDSDFGSFIFGGNVVALGSTMDWAESDQSLDYDAATMNLKFSSSRSAGDAIIVLDSKGRVVFAYDPDKDEVTGAKVRTYQGAIVSCDNFELDNSYTVYIGGEITGEEVSGVYDVTTITSITNTTQQSYGSSQGGGSSNRPGRPGSSSGSTTSGSTTFTLSSNVNSFTNVANSTTHSSLAITAWPTEAPTEAPTVVPTVAPTVAPTDAPEYRLMGDIDLDEEINIFDATYIQRYLAKYVDENIDILAGDVDGDSSITIMDATIIQKYLAHIDVSDTLLGQYVEK